jgi:hypothetical protein
MGVVAMTLSGGEYAIHGTNRPDSIGKFASYGCIRMLNDDIADLARPGDRRHRGRGHALTEIQAPPLDEASVLRAWHSRPSRSAAEPVVRPRRCCGARQRPSGPSCVREAGGRRVSVRAVQSTEGQKDGYCRRKQASTKRRDRESNDQPEGPEQRSGYHHSDDAREHQNDPHKSASIASTGIKQFVGIERALHPPNS